VLPSVQQLYRNGTADEPYMESPNSPRQKRKKKKKGETTKSKVRSMLIIFFDIKRIVHKEFVLAGQTVNSAYYCDNLH
jgi:hypothetical protein